MDPRPDHGENTCGKTWRAESSHYGRSSTKPADASAGLVVGRSLPVLVDVLRHLQVMLQCRQCLSRPILQFRIVAAFCVPFEQGYRVLVGADLHRVVLSGKIVWFGVSELIQLLLRGVIERS